MVVDQINVARVRINLSARRKTAVEVSNAILATQNPGRLLRVLIRLKAYFAVFLLIFIIIFNFPTTNN